MKKFLIIACAAILCACNGTQPENGGMRQPKQKSFASADEQLCYRTNEFTFNLTSLVCKNPDKENIILSPLSASLMLGMLMNGADGETLTQMQQVLGFEGLTPAEINDWYANLLQTLPALDDVTTVNIANSLWVKNEFPVLEDFIAVNRQFFDATADNVDMADPATADRINQWAADNTNNLIKQVVTTDEISPCVMLLANALYFKSKWSTPFEEAATYDAEFYPLTSSVTKVPTMRGTVNAPYADTKEGQLLELDYKGSKFCMDILLPEQGKDIRKVLAGFTAEDWSDRLARLRYADVHVALPKLDLHYSRMLTDDLKAAGMPKALSPAAEFPHISGIPTYLSWVKQVCHLTVDESGTEAAAVTIGGMLESCALTEPMEYKEFFANRPYLIVIREKEQGNILFTAMITNPEAK